MKKLVLLLLMILAFGTICRSQDSPSDSATVDKYLDDFVKKQQVAPEEEQTLGNVSAEDSDAEAYRRFVYEHRKAVFWWQLISNRIIFFMVLSLVVIGVYFSWLQFRLALESSTRKLKRRKSNESNEEIANEDFKVSEFEASLQGIKISSSVLGVILLAISLVFFYLFLVHVYRVTVLPEITH